MLTGTDPNSKKALEILSKGGALKDILQLNIEMHHAKMLIRYFEHMKNIQHLPIEMQEKFKDLGFKSLLLGHLIDQKNWDDLKLILNDIEPDIERSELYKIVKR
ncbi:hypothetical protein [Salinithrix halophila]|uniref:Uncharacterized protein n=1 Tax=Salinithrix halophila TaxID=1485204 RepID=A0ABV8JFJ7_9BACL